MALKGKRARFVAEYLIDQNATRAAKAAGYSPKTARQQGARLLSNAAIAAAIRRGTETVTERALVTAAEVLGELKILLNSDVRHFTVDDYGKLELAAGAPDNAWRAVSSVKHRTITSGTGDRERVTHEVEFRLWSKPEAARMLGEHLGLFPHKVDFSDVTKLTDEELAAKRKTLGLKG